MAVAYAEWVDSAAPSRSVDPPVVELGAWLKTTQAAADHWLASWLEVLVQFDRDQGWAADGLASCAQWLVAHLRLSRSAAHERLRVSHELRRRPILAAAFKAGRLSWSAVRVITRAVGASAVVDDALVTLAEAGTVTDVERVVRTYLRYADQERRPTDPNAARTLRFVPLGNGTTRMEVVVTDLEAAEIDAALGAATAADAHSKSPVETRPQGDLGPTGSNVGSTRSSPR